MACVLHYIYSIFSWTSCCKN